MGDPNGKKFSNEFWITILIFMIGISFGAGASIAAFQTKAAAEENRKEILQYMDKNYMPRELSLEKWKNNEDAHKLIMDGQKAILEALREHSAKAKKE